MKSVLADRLFHLKENGTTVRRECFAGLTTFVTMAYILAVNPAILGAAGMDRGAVFTASALAACAATLLMALLSNYPFALAPGMGLNAYFAYTVVIKQGYSWQMALAAVFLEGLLFIVLFSVFNQNKDELLNLADERCKYENRQNPEYRVQKCSTEWSHNFIHKSKGQNSFGSPCLW